jgi:hypothetical protein
MRSFSLEGVRVEHRALAPRKPFVVYLPLPPADEALFGALPGRGRFATPDYADWQTRAALKLLAAGPPHLKGPVWIGIGFEADAAIDNRARAIIDLLVRERVIETRARLRELRLAPAAITGARVIVRPFAFDEAR